VVGDVTKPETFSAPVEGVDGIVFTHGSDGGGKLGAERVDYGGVRNLEPLFGALDTDPPGSVDAVHDTPNMPMYEEPQRVRDDWDAVLR